MKCGRWTAFRANCGATKRFQLSRTTSGRQTTGATTCCASTAPAAPRSAHIKAIANAGWFGVNDTDQCRNYGEDYDLVLRTSERYMIGRVWEPIYEVIRHAGGTDHAIDQATVDRNDNAKDFMRLEALERRQGLNRA